MSALCQKTTQHDHIVGTGELSRWRTGSKRLVELSPVVAVDVVDLKITNGSGQDRCAYVSARRVSRHIANRVFTLGRSTILHVNQHGRPIGRVRLGEKTAN